MSNEELIAECSTVITTHLGRTQHDYHQSVDKFNMLFIKAANNFQRECIRTAHNRLWHQDELTLINLFDNLG